MAIYLMMDGNYVKVGFAKDVKQRMGGYRTHNPHCECIDSFEQGTKIDEEVIHEMMNKDERFTRHLSTEWYQILDELLLKKLQEEKLNYFLKLVGIVENNEEIISADVMKAYSHRTPLAQYIITEGNARMMESRRKDVNSTFCTLELDGDVDRLHRLTRREVCELASKLFQERGFKTAIYSTNRKIQILWD